MSYDKTTKENDKAMATTQKQPTTRTKLAGLFFHTFSDSIVHQQGHVMGEVSPGVYLVQFYEWLMGSPTTQQLFKLEDMFGWVFYDNEEDWIAYYEHKLGPDAEAMRSKKQDAEPKKFQFLSPDEL